MNKYYKGETMKIDDKLKKIADYICENFEDLDMDDPVEEGYLDNYEEILGATEKVRYSPYPQCQLYSVLCFVYKYSL